MIERVSIQQHTFRVPGLFRDPRGVLVGKRIIILFASLDRAVSFLAMCGDQGALGEMLSSLEIRRVQSQARSHELVISAEVTSGRELDRLSSIARLCSARTFIGGRKHFVPFRDVRGPAGYDAAALDEGDDDLVLYTETQRLNMRWGRKLSLVDLISQLDLRADPQAHAGETIGEALIWMPPGLIETTRRYLLARNVPTEMAVVDVETDSILDDGPQTVTLFRLTQAPNWVVQLFVDMPRVRVFVPASKRTFVQRSYRHPLPLVLLEERLGPGLHLFEGPSAAHAHGRAIRIDPEPAFVRLYDTLELKPEGEHVVQAQAAGEARTLAVPLRSTPGPLGRAPVATIIAANQRLWLAKLMYLMPQSALEGLQVALSESWIFIYRATGLERLPLGQSFVPHLPDLLVPSGHTLQPALKDDELRHALPLLGSHLAFIGPGSRTLYVPKESFGPLTRSAVRDIEGVLISANRPHYETRDLIFVDYDG